MEVCSEQQHIVFIPSPSIRFSGQDFVSELKCIITLVVFVTSNVTRKKIDLQFFMSMISFSLSLNPARMAFQENWFRQVRRVVGTWVW